MSRPRDVSLPRCRARASATAVFATLLLGLGPSARALPWNTAATSPLWRALVGQGDGAQIDCTHPELKDQPLCANAPPPPPPPSPADLRAASGIPSVGVAGHLWAYNTGRLKVSAGGATPVDTSSTYLMRATAGGFSAFMESPTKPVSIGIALDLWFPNVERIRPEGGPASDCTECRFDVVTSIAMIFKARIPAGKWVTPYPVLGAGFGAIQGFRLHRKAESHLGVSVTAGAGVEVNATERVMPFFEIRYQLVAGKSTETVNDVEVKEWLYYQAVVLGLGVRFY